MSVKKMFGHQCVTLHRSERDFQNTKYKILKTLIDVLMAFDE